MVNYQCGRELAHRLASELVITEIEYEDTRVLVQRGLHTRLEDIEYRVGRRLVGEAITDMLETNVLDQVCAQVEHIQQTIASQQIRQLHTVGRRDFILAQVEFAKTCVELDRGDYWTTCNR